MFKALLVATLLLTVAGSADGKYTGPKCLGPYCLASKISLRSLTKQLGTPASRSEPFCYQSETGKGFVIMDTNEVAPGLVLGVFLSDFANCMHHPIRSTAEDLTGWKTREGIGLGSNETDVLRAYGKPSFVSKLPDKRVLLRGYRADDREPKLGALADKAMAYKSKDELDLRFAEFGIRKGKVSYILLSENE